MKENTHGITVILGTAQDGGYPHVGCHRDCCRDLKSGSPQARRVACLGIVDPQRGRRWLVDCTPDFPRQLRVLDELCPSSSDAPLDGILLTHAHIGHYTGLMYLGREALNTRGLPVYAMPRMSEFLATNEPWTRLIAGGNVTLQPLEDATPVSLSETISATPFLVPHRAEFSETVGFVVRGPKRAVLYLPDVDQWDGMSPIIESLVQQVDAAYIDGTFFSAEELTGRSVADVPHPCIRDSISRFESLPESERDKIRFIHLNHTNPVLKESSDAHRKVIDAGMHVAVDGEQIVLSDTGDEIR